MSLGLETVGFDLLFANELSPMARNGLHTIYLTKHWKGIIAKTHLLDKSQFIQNEIRDTEKPFEVLKFRY
jgi:site-specific DNA-cytosine methylase